MLPATATSTQQKVKLKNLQSFALQLQVVVSQLEEKTSSEILKVHLHILQTATNHCACIMHARRVLAWFLLPVLLCSRTVQQYNARDQQFYFKISNEQIRHMT